MSTTQIILAILAAILGSSALTAFITLWFSRDKTSAEARHEDAKARHEDVQIEKENFGEARAIFKELKDTIGEFKEVHARWRDCEEEVSKANIKVGEVEAENERLDETIKAVRKENIEKDLMIVELQVRLNDAGIEY